MEVVGSDSSLKLEVTALTDSWNNVREHGKKVDQCVEVDYVNDG